MNMDFQKVADNIAAATCIVSVEKLADGSCGEIRLLTGNKSYIESIEMPMQNVVMKTRKFVPNTPYTDYMPRDLNFEDYCYRAAVQKKCLHSYAHPDRYDVWFNMTFLPLWPDEGNLCYCAYIMEINLEPSSERMSNISGDIAASVLETAIALRAAKDFKKAIKDAVGEIRELCDAKHCCLLLIDDDNQSCEVLGEAFSPDYGQRPTVNILETDFYPIASSWKDTIAGSNCIIAKNERDMDVVRYRNPVWYQSLKDNGIKTIALFPIKSMNEHLGYIWASNFAEERSTEIKEILEVTTFVLGAETANHLMMSKLKELSSRDMLTGVMNRNEMNNYVDRLSQLPADSGKSAGVMFLDLNGLKRVNDEMGHNAGDRLLRNAAGILCEQFDTEHIFRAGGDEFVIILPDTSEEELERKAGEIHQAESRYPDVSFAIGWSFDKDASQVRRTLAQADQRMYEDKKSYYAKRSTRGRDHRHL